MPTIAQLHAAQQRGRETDRLLTESLSLGVEEQQLPPPPPPNPEEFGAHFGGDDGGGAGQLLPPPPPHQGTVNSRTGGMAGSLGPAAMQPPPLRITTNHNAHVLGGGHPNSRNARRRRNRTRQSAAPVQPVQQPRLELEEDDDFALMPGLSDRYQSESESEDEFEEQQELPPPLPGMVLLAPNFGMVCGMTSVPTYSQRHNTKMAGRHPTTKAV